MARGKGLIVSGAIVIGAGLVLGAVSLVFLLTGVVGAVTDQLRAPVFSVPGAVTMSLDAGHYLVFQSPSGDPITPEDVAVVGPGGSDVPVDALTLDQSMSRGSVQYQARAGFDAVTDGTYQVAVKGGSSAFGGTAFVGRDIVDVATHRAGWGFGIAGGVLLVLVGLILLVVGLTQRRRSQQELAPAFVPAAYGAPGYPPAYPPGYPPAYPPAQPYPGAQPYPPGQPYQPAQPPAAPAVEQPGTGPQEPAGAQPTAPVPPAPPAPAGPPAGWYPDPSGQGRRYWDGAAWTEHRAP